eukprot:jgi/Mesvir1/15469/Mv20010-RA.1
MYALAEMLKGWIRVDLPRVLTGFERSVEQPPSSPALHSCSNCPLLRCLGGELLANLLKKGIVVAGIVDAAPCQVEDRGRERGEVEAQGVFPNDPGWGRQTCPSRSR